MCTSGNTMLPGSLAIPAVYWWSANRVGLVIGMAVALAVALPVLGYLKRFDVDDHPNPERALAVANGVANGVWSLLPILMMPEQPEHQYLVLALPFAMLATNLAVTAPARRVYFAGQIPHVISSMVAFIVFADGNTKWAAAVIAVTVLTLDGLGQDWKRTAHENAMLQQNNDQLVADLEAANSVLAHLSHHDALTGLSNRREFTRFVAGAHPDFGIPADQGHSIMLIDLDRFKAVNDDFGHYIGDELLVQAARRLKSVTPNRPSLSRLGGDEFAIVWKEAHTPEALMRLAREVNAQLRTPFSVEGQIVSISASIGIAIGEDGSQSAAEVLRNADHALYVAKASGGDQAVVFQDDAHDASTRPVNDRTQRFGPSHGRRSHFST